MDSLAFAIKSKTHLGFNDHVGELHNFERDFLQVLLHKFSLIRSERGVRLSVAFDHRSPAIGTREARRFVRTSNPTFDKTATGLKVTLQEVYSGRRSAFNHDDDEFPFRYASGGTVPILTVDGMEYYCLFLRGLHPIGWNLANGGCNSIEELCNPTKTIARELQEELLVVDSENWYSFGSAGEDSVDRPEFAVAREYWNSRFDALGLPHFDQLKRHAVQVADLEGPDTLEVKFLQEPLITHQSLFVSVTAEDYGIEVDRLLVLPPLHRHGLVLCDGEINAARSVNRPIGVFRTSNFDAAGQPIPDYFYYSGIRYDGDALQEVITNRVIPDLETSEPAPLKHVVPEFRSAAMEGFPLCPIARQLIPRVQAFRAAE
jgi:hypothetical protein